MAPPVPQSSTRLIDSTCIQNNPAYLTSTMSSPPPSAGSTSNNGRNSPSVSSSSSYHHHNHLNRSTSRSRSHSKSNKNKKNSQQFLQNLLDKEENNENDIYFKTFHVSLKDLTREFCERDPVLQRR